MKDQLKKLLVKTLANYESEENDKIIKGIMPVLWFGDLDKYLLSPCKIITVSINPSNIDFCKSYQILDYSPKHRFPDYDGSVESLIVAYNNYFKSHRNPYNSWFKTAFRGVLKGFDASHYDGEINNALHSDICTPYATYPTWSNLSAIEKGKLESHGQEMWNALIELLEPDVILFSASPGFYKKILFEKQFPDWSTIYQRGNKQPVLHNQVNINGKYVDVIYQTQGRLPFLSMNAEEKLNLKNLLETHKNGKA